MKKYSIIIAFAALCSLSACKDFLEVQPTDFALTSNFYQNKQQVDYAVAALYANLKNTNLGENFQIRVYGSSDECYYYSNGQLGPATWQNDPTNTDITNCWTGCYTSINYCNTLLDNIDRSTGLDADVKNRAIGEALFLRGYYNFVLAQWFGDIPLHTKATTSFADGVRERTPVKQVYDQIIEDMTKADTLLANQTLATLGYPERVTRNAVQAMLVRVCLYAAGEPVNDKKRYADALSWANKLKATGYHALNTKFPQIFINMIQDKYDLKESIWEVGHTYIGQTSTLNTTGVVGVYNGVRQTYTPTVNGTLQYDSGYCYGYHLIHPRLYNAFQAGDTRRDWTIGNYTFNATAQKTPLTSTQLWERYPAKWRREYESTPTRILQRANSTNWGIIRYADVLLMLAEAENEVNGPTAAAYDAINQVRRRSISTTPIVDQVNMTNQGSGYTTPPSVTISGGGGSGAAVQMYFTGGKVALILTSQGNGYTTAPTITIGDQWVANTAYSVGTQVAAGGKLYTVTTAGISTTTAPTNTSGASSAATTGAVFTYAGVAAVATAVLSAQPVVDLPQGLSKEDFRKAIQDERYRELAFEGLRIGDLRRWGILISTIKGMANDVNGNTPGIPATTNVTYVSPALTPCNAISQRDVFWPIPTRDLLLNPKMTQNPGF